MINKDLLKKLCFAFGPSGNEDEARDIIIGEIKDFADDYYVDKVGNLIAFKKGGKTPDKKRLFSAHMDEVGFMITSVNDDGYLKFKNLGGIENAVILGKQATVGEKRFPAVFGGKPIHLIKKEDREKARSTDDIYLDIGVIKKEKRQRAFALLVAFLYGGFIWAFFPSLYIGTSISWEGHLSGLLTGIILAVYYRNEGPQPPPPDEEDDYEKEAN